MFPGCLQDFSRMFSGCSDGSYWPGGIWWSFQMKVWTLKIQRNPMIPNYSMIPAAAIRWSPAIRWSIRGMDFDNRKVYGDTSITDGLVNAVTDCGFSFDILTFVRITSYWCGFCGCLIPNLSRAFYSHLFPVFFSLIPLVFAEQAVKGD